MNYVIIANSNTPSTEVPPNVSQTFTDEELQLLGMIMVEIKADYIQRDLMVWSPRSEGYVEGYRERMDVSKDLEAKGNALATMIQLLQRWEVKTQ